MGYIYRQDISIHALLTESDPPPNSPPFHLQQISIHALLTESDGMFGCQIWNMQNFNPRSPHGERHYTRPPGSGPGDQFQSTLSSRRATEGFLSNVQGHHISIHALLTESDDRPGPQKLPAQTFQSTLSSRRATFLDSLLPNPIVISIHALLTESDGGNQFVISDTPMISIHALLTESDASSVIAAPQRGQFQSTLSSRRATHGAHRQRQPVHYFNPRSPHGERPLWGWNSPCMSIFQSTLSSRRATVVE